MLYFPRVTDSSEASTFYQNVLVMRNTVDVTGGKFDTFTKFMEEMENYSYQ
jgi:hypothetical protein